MEQNKKILLEEFYKPSEEIRKFIYDVYSKYLKWRNLKEQNYKQFNNSNLISYIQEARQKFWGYIPLSYDTDTPQFFFPETRNQIISILSKIANLRVKPSFEGVEGFDVVKATILSDLFEFYMRGSNRKIDNFWQFLYTVINGTCVVFVAYKNKKRNIRKIVYHDPDTGKTKYRKDEVDDSDVKEVIVNLEDLFIPKIWEPSIQEQDEIIWRTLMKWSDFQNAFKNYSNVSYVIPGSQFSDSSIFSDFLSYDIRGGDFVEVIKYFNAPEDKYAIIANGVLLNTIKNENEEEDISPLPWNHKVLPFAKTIFEPLDTNFFFGMPLAQKIKHPQEAINRLWELMLDREQRSVAAPIITNDPSVETGIEFKAGRVYQVQGDVNSYKELNVSPTSGSFWNAMNVLDTVIQRTGSGGNLPLVYGKQPRSASEAAINAQRMRETSGLYFLFYQDLLEQKTWLILQNMIQFYTSGKVEKIIGDKKFLKVLALTNVELNGGGIGNHEIRITNKISSPEELRNESYMRSLLRKEKVEIIEVTPDALRDMKFDIKIKFEQENAPETERALFLDYIKTVMALFGQTGILDPKKVYFRLAEKFNENPADLVNDNVISEYELERFGISGVAQQPPQINESLANNTPFVNSVNSMIRNRGVSSAGPAQRMMNQGLLNEDIFNNNINFNEQ